MVYVVWYRGRSPSDGPIKSMAHQSCPLVLAVLIYKIKRSMVSVFQPCLFALGFYGVLRNYCAMTPSALLLPLAGTCVHALFCPLLDIYRVLGHQGGPISNGSRKFTLLLEGMVCIYSPPFFFFFFFHFFFLYIRITLVRSGTILGLWSISRLSCLDQPPKPKGI
jgi:hypothetical protein